MEYLYITLVSILFIAYTDIKVSRYALSKMDTYGLDVHGLTEIVGGIGMRILVVTTILTSMTFSILLYLTITGNLCNMPISDVMMLSCLFVISLYIIRWVVILLSVKEITSLEVLEPCGIFYMMNPRSW